MFQFQFCVFKITANQEITSYLIGLRGQAADHLDPFPYWSSKSVSYPHIHDVAVNILSIPATSASSERIFSRASFLLGRKRHNLSDRKLEMEVMFKANMHFLE